MVKRAVGTSCFLVAALLLLVIGSSQAAPAGSGCRTAKGKLVDERAVAGPGIATTGMFLGTLRGRYEFEVTWIADAGDATIPSVLHFVGHAVVHTSAGDIRLTEAGAIDTAAEGKYATLLTVTGGTGKWANASGQIVLTGAFNFATGEGEGRYSGKVCVS
jgi:hypothetical protein